MTVMTKPEQDNARAVAAAPLGNTRRKPELISVEQLSHNLTWI